MFDQLLKLATENLEGLSHSIPELNTIDPGKLNNVTSQTIVNTIMQQLKGGNLNSVKELFSGNHTTDNHEIVNQLKSPVANSLIDKLGLSEGSANQLAMMAIPIVMNMMNGRVKSAENNGLDINSLLNNLHTSGKSGGGFLNSITKIFGGGGNTGNMKIVNSIISNLMK